MKKLLAVLLSMILVLGLFAGCGEDDSANAGNNGNGGSANSDVGESGEGSGNQESSVNNQYGAVLVNANAAVEIFYDSNGLVLKIEGYYENGEVVAGNCDNYLGKPCADVVCDVITGSSNAGYLTPDVNYVVIKQRHGSSVPTESFLSSIEKDAAEAIVAADSQAKLIVLTLDDLFTDGYYEGFINTDSAKKLMQAYVGSEKTDYLCVGNEEPIDGKYGFLFGYEDIPEEKLIVDATTGAVFPGELEGVDYGDDFTEDDTLVTEPTEDILGDVNEPEETDPTVATDDIEEPAPTESVATE